MAGRSRVRGIVRFGVGIVLTAGFGYASYWVWLEVQMQIRGTIVSSFGIFAAVLAAFVLLGLAHFVIGRLEGLLERDKKSSTH